MTFIYELNPRSRKIRLVEHPPDLSLKIFTSTILLVQILQQYHTSPFNEQNSIIIIVVNSIINSDDDDDDDDDDEEDNESECIELSPLKTISSQTYSK